MISNLDKQFEVGTQAAKSGKKGESMDILVYREVQTDTDVTMGVYDMLVQAQQ